MILAEVVDRAFDRSPTTLLIGQLFRIQLRSTEFPIETPRFQGKPCLEIIRIAYHVAR